MKPRLHEANLEDESHCAALLEIIDTYASGPGGQSAPLSPEARKNLCPGLRSHPMATTVFASVGDKIVGAAVCVRSFSTFAGKPSLNIHDLAVLPDYQGQGIGRELLGEVERRARAMGCCKVMLEVHDTNARAKHLYESVGFGPWESPTIFVSKMLAPTG